MTTAELIAGRIARHYDEDAREVAAVLMAAARREDGSIRDHGFYNAAKALEKAAAEIEHDAGVVAADAEAVARMLGIGETAVP